MRDIEKIVKCLENGSISYEYFAYECLGVLSKDQVNEIMEDEIILDAILELEE